LDKDKFGKKFYRPPSWIFSILMDIFAIYRQIETKFDWVTGQPMLNFEKKLSAAILDFSNFNGYLRQPTSDLDQI
jgi:hypothetical protein